MMSPLTAFVSLLRGLICRHSRRVLLSDRAAHGELSTREAELEPPPAPGA